MAVIILKTRLPEDDVIPSSRREDYWGSVQISMAQKSKLTRWYDPNKSQ
jgi:hypothetical protein